MVSRALAAFLPRHDPAMETGKTMSARPTWLSKKSWYPCYKVLLFFWCLGSKPNSSRCPALFASQPASQPHLTQPWFRSFLWGRPEGRGVRVAWVCPTFCSAICLLPVSFHIVLAHLQIQPRSHLSGLVICLENTSLTPNQSCYLWGGICFRLTSHFVELLKEEF